MRDSVMPHAAKNPNTNSANNPNPDNISPPRSTLTWTTMKSENATNIDKYVSQRPVFFRKPMAVKRSNHPTSTSSTTWPAGSTMAGAALHQYTALDRQRLLSETVRDRNTAWFRAKQQPSNSI